MSKTLNFPFEQEKIMTWIVQSYNQKKKKKVKIFLPNFGYVISNLSKFDNFTDHEYKQCLQKVK